MKNLAICFITFSTLSSIQVEQKSSELIYNFDDAIKKNITKCEIITNGGHSRESVRLTMTNLKSKSVNITVPKGTYFIPKDESDQNLLIVVDKKILLAGNEKKVFNLNAFCIEPEDSSPMEGQTMTYSKVDKGTPLESLCDYVNDDTQINVEEADEAEAIQSAIWAVTDEQPIEHIPLRTIPTRKLREEVCRITERDNSWYTIDFTRELGQDRRIKTNSTSLGGELSINLAEPAKISEVVKDTNGKVKMRTNYSVFTKGNWNYWFNIYVEGWPTGDYTVEVIKNGVSIKSFPFQV